MAQGFHDFTSGAILTAGDLEDYCELQSIMRFASAAARTTALSGVLTEGLMCYLIDLNEFQVYNGSSWVVYGRSGVWSTWTPAVVQLGAVTVTVTYASYFQLGALVVAQCALAVTGSGTNNNVLTISLPVSALRSTSSGMDSIGTMTGYDASTGAFYVSSARPRTATTADGVLTSSGDNPLGVYGFSGGLASGDVLSMSVTYQAA